MRAVRSCRRGLKRGRHVLGRGGPRGRRFEPLCLGAARLQEKVGADAGATRPVVSTFFLWPFLFADVVGRP